DLLGLVVDHHNGAIILVEHHEHAGTSFAAISANTCLSSHRSVVPVAGDQSPEVPSAWGLWVAGKLCVRCTINAAAATTPNANPARCTQVATEGLVIAPL